MSIMIPVSVEVGETVVAHFPVTGQKATRESVAPIWWMNGHIDAGSRQTRSAEAEYQRILKRKVVAS